jgi:uncharacterized membrane protein
MGKNNLFKSNGGQHVLSEIRVDNLLVIFSYSLQEFLYWWYVRMPLWHLRMLSRISTLADDNLSLSLLIKNFLLPWHRDYSLIGYVFGILIKVIYLPVAFIVYIFANLVYVLVILGWLLLPPATIFFIIRSILRI